MLKVLKLIVDKQCQAQSVETVFKLYIGASHFKDTALSNIISNGLNFPKSQPDYKFTYVWTQVYPKYRFTTFMSKYNYIDLMDFEASCFSISNGVILVPTVYSEVCYW